MPLSRHNSPQSKAMPKQTLELSVTFLIFVAVFLLAIGIVSAKSDNSSGEIGITSVVGDSQPGCSRTADLTWYGSVTASASSYCPSGHGLFDRFNNSWYPYKEFKNSVSCTNCIVELYCCDHPEPTSDSQCKNWVGSNSIKLTANCVVNNDFRGGYWCSANGITERNIPYQYSSFNYCSADVYRDCWYIDGTTCLKRHYSGETRTCSEIGTYQGNTLYSSQSTCESHICYPDNSCAANTCWWNTCRNNCGQTIQGAKNCPCELISANWIGESAMKGDAIALSVNGNPACNGKGVNFEVWENSWPLSARPASQNPPSSVFSGSTATTTWTAEWLDDYLGNPEYYFIAYADGKSITSSNEVTVACADNDGDGFSVCQNDCDDNNKNIYPGAIEICNSHDDDCDSQVDEGFNLQTDKNNCGSCGNTCSSGYVCNSGKCKGCGDKICSPEIGESPSTCLDDCHGNLTITQLTTAPSNVRQGQQVTVQAKIENIGNYVKTLSVEAGIVPDSWKGIAFTLQGTGIQSSIPIKSCCSANNYYVAKNITLNAGQSEVVTFNLYAPTPSSTDACNGLGSAWSDISHKLVIGLYEKCHNGYIDEISRDIKVYKTCTSQAECPTTNFCDFNSGFPGICKPKALVNECSVSGSYSCVGSEIKKCIDTNGDGYLKLVYIDYCQTGSICIPGQSTCQSAPKTKVQIEYAGLSTTVNKQKGDLVKLRLEYAGIETITLSYNSNVLELLSCSDTFTITSDKDCLFEVKGTPSDAEYNIGLVSGQQGKLRIMSNPLTIIVTDRAKLLERYGDEDEVDAMLKQAYATAQQQTGVVYDVGDYLTNNLWKSPSEYEGGAYAV